MNHLKKRRQTVGKPSYVTLSDGTLVRVTAQATMPLASRLMKVSGRSSFRRALVGGPLTARGRTR